MRSRGGDDGLTLLDVLVAFVIAGIAFGVVLQASALYLRQTGDAWQVSIAVVWGEAKAALSEVGAEPGATGFLAPVGALSQFTWSIVPSPIAQRRAAEVAWERRGKHVGLQAGSQIDPSAW